MRKMIEGKHLANSSYTVDLKTGKKTKTKVNMMMLPAKEGTCEDCATAHDPNHPHNAQSMFYQYKFYNDRGRWPNWKDAMKHCAAPVKKRWTELLVEKGVDVKGGAVNPRSKGNE